MPAWGFLGSVEVICLNAVSPYTRRLHSWLLTGIVQSAGHGGHATAAAIRDTLRRPPWRITDREFKSFLSVIGGDGAVVRGGEGRTSAPGTSAAEHLWCLAHPELGLIRDDLPLAEQLDGMKFRLRDPSRLWLSTEWDE